jgi:hypothetical protein
MHQQPGFGGGKIRAWKDGTVMTVIGGPVDLDGYTWIQVAGPDRRLGWIPERYLIRFSSSPP